MSSKKNRLIIVSNRLPIVLKQKEEGEWQVKAGSGGLITALAPVLQNRGGLWIGWPGTAQEHNGKLKQVLSEQTESFGYTLKPVSLTEEETQKYYKGFANEVIWPLFHDFAAFCNFEPDYWKTYLQVNRKFARAIKQNLTGQEFIWVHDYHLMGVAEELRELEVNSRLAFFLHTPFPALDIFVRLPWRFQVLLALLKYDLIGFQTVRDRRNFLHCVRRLVPGAKVEGRGQVKSLRVNGREIRVGAFPISIDFDDFVKSARRKKVEQLASSLTSDSPERQMLLGVDRLDYSKGIVERLKGYRNALRRFPELRQKSYLVQVVVPSRKTIPQYAHLKTEIEQLVGQINGEFTRPGWIPVHYMFRSLNRVELLAHYRASDIALITPLKDGMNLVAKEYCACNLKETGVLIMSEFAGAAAQFQNDALLVNPHNIEEIADAIHRAFMKPAAQRERKMRNLRGVVSKQDIFWWVDSFLKAAFARNLRDFPVLADYIPQDFSKLDSEAPEVLD